MSNITDDDIALAAEFALGLLDAGDAEKARTLYAARPDFAEEVDAWRERMLPLYDGLDVAPPEGVWQQISKQIVPMAPANDNRPLLLWKRLTGASTVIAAALAVILFMQNYAAKDRESPIASAPALPQPTMVAALQGSDGAASILASFDPESGEFLMTPVVMDTGALYPEVWIIPADGTARSLGVMKREGASRAIIVPAMRQYLTNGSTLAITPEQAAGAPGGKATGAIIASGKITLI
jgi:anti-sigma-K factor RskA